MDKRTKNIRHLLREAAELYVRMLDDQPLIDTLEQLFVQMLRCVRHGGKILLCGNGGSAADAQHIAAELTGRLSKNRPPIQALALNTNVSELTAISNDLGFDHLFDRLVEAHGRAGDLLIALSTSGQSENIRRALLKAHAIGMVTTAWTGSLPNPLQAHCDYHLRIPSTSTQRIQEGHILCGHVLCQLLEDALFDQ